MMHCSCCKTGPSTACSRSASSSVVCSSCCHEPIDTSKRACTAVGVRSGSADDIITEWESMARAERSVVRVDCLVAPGRKSSLGRTRSPSRDVNKRGRAKLGFRGRSGYQTNAECCTDLGRLCRGCSHYGTRIRVMWDAVDPSPATRGGESAGRHPSAVEPDAALCVRGGGPQGHNSPEAAHRRLNSIHGLGVQGEGEGT